MSEHYEIVNLERLVKSKEQDLDRLRAENARLRECLEPGKASGINAGLFEAADRLGLPHSSVKHALTRLVEEIERLRKDNARLQSDLHLQETTQDPQPTLGDYHKSQAELSRLEQALEKAREWFYDIDVAVDDTCGSDLKQMCRDALRHIDEVLK